MSTEPTLQIDIENIVAVVDTNVLLDVFSCHDLVRKYESLGAVAALDSPDAIYRRARARESMLLAMYFHRVRAVTYSLREGYRLMPTKVDPDAHEAWETHYTKVFVHFVRERLLDGWTPCMPLVSGDDSQGSVADAELVAYARDHGKPLVTNEALTPNGIGSDKMRRKAEAAGVKVFAPRQFYSGKIDEADEIADFVRRFREQGPDYVRNHPKPTLTADTMDTLDGYYRHILLGETRGEATPVRVTL